MRGDQGLKIRGQRRKDRAQIVHRGWVLRSHDIEKNRATLAPVRRFVDFVRPFICQACLDLSRRTRGGGAHICAPYGCGFSGDEDRRLLFPPRITWIHPLLPNQRTAESRRGRRGRLVSSPLSGKLDAPTRAKPRATPSSSVEIDHTTPSFRRMPESRTD